MHPMAAAVILTRNIANAARSKHYGPDAFRYTNTSATVEIVAQIATHSSNLGSAFRLRRDGVVYTRR